MSNLFSALHLVSTSSSHRLLRFFQSGSSYPRTTARECFTRFRNRIAGSLLLAFFCVATVTLPDTAFAQAAAEESAASGVVVNINTAPAEEMALVLRGVGPSKAAAIVRYRELFGPFQTIDELAEVAGIGLATVEQNRAQLRVE